MKGWRVAARVWVTDWRAARDTASRIWDVGFGAAFVWFVAVNAVRRDWSMAWDAFMFLALIVSRAQLAVSRYRTRRALELLMKSNTLLALLAQTGGRR